MASFGMNLGPVWIPEIKNGLCSMDKIARHNAQAWDALVEQNSGFASKISARCLNDPDPYINIYGWLPHGVRQESALPWQPVAGSMDPLCGGWGKRDGGRYFSENAGKRFGDVPSAWVPNSMRSKLHDPPRGSRAFGL